LAWAFFDPGAVYTVIQPASEPNTNTCSPRRPTLTISFQLALVYFKSYKYDRYADLERDVGKRDYLLLYFGLHEQKKFEGFAVPASKKKRIRGLRRTGFKTKRKTDDKSSPGETLVRF
jgi:hypothetical protein